MKTKDRIAQSYKFFSLGEGSHHIASEYAILKLQELILKFRIKNVMEVGLGIGSIAGTLLEINRKLYYSGTETNEFCLRSLSMNLGMHYKRLVIYPDLQSVPFSLIFDLIIVDGKDNNLEFVKKILSKRGVIIVEGDRLKQQKVLQNCFPHYKMVHSISLRKNKSYSPFPTEDWQGGIKIIFVNPSAGQYIWWFKERILTMLKYRYPGRFFGKNQKIV